MSGNFRKVSVMVRGCHGVVRLQHVAADNYTGLVSTTAVHMGCLALSIYVRASFVNKSAKFVSFMFNAVAVLMDDFIHC